MTTKQSAAEVVQSRVFVPLPPPSLRANSRAHWTRKSNDAANYSRTVVVECAGQGPFPKEPWKKAEAHYEWRYAGVEPDHSNLGGHTKYLQDTLCCAPQRRRAVPAHSDGNRWYMGIVDDDKGITATFEAVKVAHRDEEGVLVTLRRVR